MIVEEGMSGVDRSGTGPLSSKDIKAYKEEYLHGADLFERALEQCSQAPNIYQQEAFKRVMKQTMQVLNETARGLKRPDLIQQNEKIAQDFEAYDDHMDPLAQRVLMEDLEKAKAFAASDDVRQTMQKAGVSDKPDVYFLK